MRSTRSPPTRRFFVAPGGSDLSRIARSAFSRIAVTSQRSWFRNAPACGPLDSGTFAEDLLQSAVDLLRHILGGVN
jgi:hypothetical protein